MTKRNSVRRRRGRSTDEDDGYLRKSEQNERYERVYTDVVKLRNFLREQYVEALSDKVRQQRKEIKEQDRKNEERLEHDERERQHAAVDALHRRFQKVTITKAGEESEEISKSNFYKILEVQEKMKKQHKLDSFASLELFWRRQLQNVAEHGEVLSADNALLNRPDERPKSSQSGRPPSLRRRRKYIGSHEMLDTLFESETSSQAEESLAPRSARRFPVLHKPDLKSFAIDLSPKTISEDEFMKICDRFDQRRRRALFREQLDIVSQKSIAHSLLSRKQLQAHENLVDYHSLFYEEENEDDLDFCDTDLREPTLRDRIQHFDSITAKVRTQPARTRHNLDPQLPCIMDAPSSTDSRRIETVKSSVSKYSRQSKSADGRQFTSSLTTRRSDRESPTDRNEQSQSQSQSQPQPQTVPLSLEQMLLNPDNFQNSLKEGQNPHIVWLPNESHP